MDDKLYVRIKPSNNRLTQVVYGLQFLKEKGWYILERSVAESLRKVRMHGPTTPCVFDIVTKDEAAMLMEGERKKVDPAGTVAEPKEIAVTRSAFQPPDASGLEVDALRRDMLDMRKSFETAWSNMTTETSTALTELEALLDAERAKSARLLADLEAATAPSAKTETVSTTTTTAAAEATTTVDPDLPPPPAAPPTRGGKAAPKNA